MSRFFKSPIVLYISIALALIIAAIFLNISRVSTKNSQQNFVDIMDTNQSAVRINSVNIPVEVASDDTSRDKGLSGRASLDPNSGMLFVFDKSAIYTFWMPDMHFPIDIIWINDNKVVDISKNVSNNFDPQNPDFYEPTKSAQYVLEVNSGFSEKENIKIGDDVIINRK